MTNEQREIIQYHIDNKFIMTIDRCYNDETTSVMGFPICMSDEFIITTVITDFHDEGYAVLRVKDIVDAYSNESDSIYEQICVSEGLQDKIQQKNLKGIESLEKILLQLKDYDGFVCIQCEQQIEKCSFYMGNIISVESKSVVFKDIGTDGKWDEECHTILYDEITQISFGDNYSRMFYKHFAMKTN